MHLGRHLWSSPKDQGLKYVYPIHNAHCHAKKLEIETYQDRKGYVKT